MIIELKGFIYAIEKKKVISDNLTLQNVIITIDSDKAMPQNIIGEVRNERMVMLDVLKVGDEVNARAFLNGHEHNGRHFVTLTIFDICLRYFVEGARVTPKT